MGSFPPTHTGEGESVPQSGSPWDRHTHTKERMMLIKSRKKKGKFCVSLSLGPPKKTHTKEMLPRRPRRKW